MGGGTVQVFLVKSGGAGGEAQRRVFRSTYDLTGTETGNHEKQTVGKSTALGTGLKRGESLSG